jgi:hypothetical protein
MLAAPHFGGWEIYHMKGSPADPNRLYASQCSGWFGQQVQRSDDGGGSDSHRSAPQICSADLITAFRNQRDQSS